MLYYSIVESKISSNYTTLKFLNLRTSASITPNFNVLLFPYISSADLGWVSVSTMAKTDEVEIPEDEKTLIDFIQDQNFTKVEECIQRKPNLVKKKDTNGMYSAELC